MSEEHIERKRRRKRRRKRAAVFTPVAESDPKNPPTRTPQDAVREADEDTAPIEPGHVKGAAIVTVIPVRYMEILNWLALARGQSVDQCVASIIRGHLTTLKPSYREATSGTIGKTARKGAEFDRLTDRLRPGGVG